MAKKQAKLSESDERKAQILRAFGEIENSDRLKDKKADPNAVKMDIVDLLRDTIQKQLRKDYDPEVEARVIINPDRGDFEVYILKEVVEEVDLPSIEISLQEAEGIDDSLELGDFYEVGPVNLEDYLTRKSIQIIKQAVQKKMRDAERQAIYEECLEKVGEVVSAEVYQVRQKEALFTYNTTKDHKVELLLPNSERMPKDNPRKNPRMRLYVKRIEREKIKVKLEDGTEVEREREDGPMKVIVSRTDDRFLHKLFESEVPEIYEGLIVVKGIARVPGERAKVSVESTSSRIDPVGACVGHRGKRIQNIVRELNNENIDVICFSDEPQIYIARALQPAKIDPMTVHVDPKTRKSRVMLKPDQIKYAIGRNGNNIHLAEKMTGYEIEIYRDISDKALEDPDDIDIIAFREEFGDDMIYQLLDNGYDTAKKILEAGAEAIGNALIAPPRREETLDFGRKVQRQYQPRALSESEQRYWKKIAESIYKTIKEEFDDEDGAQQAAKDSAKSVEKEEPAAPAPENETPADVADTDEENIDS